MYSIGQAQFPNRPTIGKIYCLSGCTAVGKTELALTWAEAFDAEIVSCDSLLFYRGMDIGTAKPTPAELKRVPHHLIDIAEPSEQMDVGRYIDLAIDSIQEIQGRGKNVLITGGSGFYLKAFFEPVVDDVQISEAVSEKAAQLMAQGLESAVDELRTLNPEGLENLDTNNPRRVIKALERCLQTSKTLQELKRDFGKLGNPLTEAEKSIVVLERDKEELNGRITQRVDQMLEQGLLEEVERLRVAGIERNPSARNAIGYRETIAYLKGEYDRETMLEKIRANTRRLAKKQRTWFRGQLPEDARYVNASQGSVSAKDLFG